jgi:hypothetical protein
MSIDLNILSLGCIENQIVHTVWTPCPLSSVRHPFLWRLPGDGLISIHALKYYDRYLHPSSNPFNHTSQGNWDTVLLPVSHLWAFSINILLALLVHHQDVQVLFLRPMTCTSTRTISWLRIERTSTSTWSITFDERYNGLSYNRRSTTRLNERRMLMQSRGTNPGQW